MTPIKSILILVLSLATTHAFSQYTDVINSNRPGVSRSAFSVGTNVVQFEAGPYIINEERIPDPSYKVSGFGADFTVRYGLLLEQLEVNIEGSYQNDTKTLISEFTTKEKRSNFKYLTVGAKYLIFDPYKDPEKNKPDLYSWKANHSFQWRSLVPAVSIYAGVNFDTNNNPYIAPGVEGISPKVMIATQNNFPGGWVFILNLIKDRIGTNQSDFQYITTLTHSFSPQWVIFGEVQGIKSDFYADNLFRLGGAYLMWQDFQLDTALTFNAKDTPTVFSVNFGMSYRLDFHKDKEPKEKDIDNGTSAKDEGKRRKNRKNGENGAEEGDKIDGVDVNDGNAENDLNDKSSKKKKKRKKKKKKKGDDDTDTDEPVKKQKKDDIDFDD